jgi:hypothetical protein
MIELLFIACLSHAPDACEERRISYVAEIGLMTCMMQAQPQLAQWVERYPTMRIARWRCRYADPSERKA